MSTRPEPTTASPRLAVRPLPRPATGPGVPVEPDPGRWLLRRAGGTAQVILGMTLLLYLLGPLRGLGESPLPLILGLLLGLPHGAVDHLVPAWRSVRARRRPARLAVLLGYAGIAGGGLLAFHHAPAPATLIFLVLSIAHFGAADEAFHAERDGRVLRLRIHAVLAYGGPPVVLPLALWRAEVDPLLAMVAPGLPDLLSTEVRALALGAVLLAIPLTLRGELREGRRGDAHQPFLLAVVFLVVPPPLAIGAYFAGWHSLRHTVRLLRADPRNAAPLRAGRVGPPLSRFAVAAAAPSLAAGVLLVVMLVGAGREAAMLSQTIAVLAALTLPHAALVAWMDRACRPRRSATVA